MKVVRNCFFCIIELSNRIKWEKLNLKLYITIKPAGICAILFPHLLYLSWISLQKKLFKEFYWFRLRCWNRCCTVEVGNPICVYVMSPYRECLHLILPTPIGYTLAGVMTTGQGFIACCRKTFDKTGTLQEKSQTQHIYLYSSGALAQTSLFFCAHRWLFSVGL